MSSDNNDSCPVTVKAVVCTGPFWTRKLDYHHCCWPQCEWSRPRNKAGAIRENVSYWHTTAHAASRALSLQAWGTQGAKKSMRLGPWKHKHDTQADSKMLCIKIWQDGQKHQRQEREGERGQRMGEGEVSHVESYRGDVMWCAEKEKTISDRGGKADMLHKEWCIFSKTHMSILGE